MANSSEDVVYSVSMDSKDFEKKASNAEKLLDGFSKALMGIKGPDGKQMTNGLNSIQNELKNTQNAFGSLSGYGMAKMVALGNIVANVATSMGNKLKNAITSGPSEGFKQYENKLQQVLTIQSNVSKSQKKYVVSELQNLRDYANNAQSVLIGYKDMTKATSDWISAGVGSVKTARIMTQGISNLSAATGADANQTRTAMYQLSQSMAAGKLQWQDWKSVVNAGMGGGIFQKQLIKSAQASGLNVKNFRDMKEAMSKGTVSAKILQDALVNMASDKTLSDAGSGLKSFSALFDSVKMTMASGWADTWEMIIGDLEEAPKIIAPVAKELYNIVGASKNARNNLLKDFIKLGGRQSVIDGIAAGYSNIVKVVNTVREAFHEIFPPTTGKQLADMANNFKTFMQSIKISDSTLKNVKDTAKGFFSIFSIGKKIITGIGKAFIALIPPGLMTNIFKILGAIGRMITAIDKAIKPSENLGKVLGSIGGVLGQVIETIADVFSGGVSTLEASTSTLESIGGIIATIFQKIGETATWLIQELSLGDVVAIGLIPTIIKAYKKLKDVFSNFAKAGGMISQVSGILDSVGNSLDAFTKAVQAKALLTIAIAVGILAVSLKLLSTLKVEQMLTGLVGLGGAIGGLILAFRKISEIGTGSIKDTIKAIATILALATALLTLSIALKIMSTINPLEMVTALAGLAGTVLILVLAMKSLSKVGKIGKTAAPQFIILAGSIVILTAAIKILSTIEATSLLKAVTALGLIFLELGIFMKVVNKTKISPASAVAIMLIAAAINVIVASIQTLSAIKTDSLLKGLGTIAAIMVMFTLLAKVLQNQASFLGVAAGMLIMAAAINALVGPIQRFGSMSIETLAKGLITLALALGILVVALRAAKGGIAGAVAIGVMAASLGLLVPVIQTLGGMSIASLATGLIAMAAALAIVGVAANLIGMGGAVALLALAAAIGAIALAAMAFALSASVVVNALRMMAESSANTINNIITNLAAFGKGFITVIPIIAQGILTLVTTMAAKFAGAAPALAASAFTMLLGFLNVFLANLPMIVNVVGQIIITFLGALAGQLPQIVMAGVNFIISFINGMANAIMTHQQTIITAVLNLTTSLMALMINGILTAMQLLVKNIPLIGPKMAAGLETAKGSVNAAMDSMKQSVGAKATATGTTAALNTAKGMNAKMAVVRKSGVTLSKNIENGLKSSNPKIRKQAQNAAIAAAKGFDSKAGDTGKGAKKGADKAVKELKNAEPKAKASGANFSQGFINGIGSKSPVAAATQLAADAVAALRRELKERSPSRVTRQSGIFFVQGFINGVKALAAPAVKTVTGLARVLGGTFGSVVTAPLKPAYKKIEEFKNGVKKSLASANIVKMINFGKITYLENKAIKAANAVAKKFTTTLQKKLASKSNQKKMGKTLSSQVSSVMKDMPKAIKSYNKQMQSLTKGLKKTVTNITNQLNKDIKEAWQGVVDNTMQSVSIFEKFTPQKTSGTKLIKYMDSQVAGMKDYLANMNIISNSGVSETFMGMLYDQGIDAAGQMKALSKLTKAELQAYEKQYNAKMTLAKQLADKQANTNGSALNKQIKAMTAAAKAEINAAYSEYNKAISTYKAKLAAAQKAMTAAGKKVGMNSVKGIIAGLKATQAALDKQVKYTANSIKNTLNKALKIHSPSRLLFQSGMNAGKGVLLGWVKMGSPIIREVENVAESIKEAISAAQQKVAALTEADMTLRPTIAPIMDMDTVDKQLADAVGISLPANLKAVSGITINNNTFNIGEINISMEVPNMQTGEITMKEFKNKFDTALSDIIKTGRRLR